MNILIESGDVNPHFAEGTKNIILTHAKELVKKKHNVIILTRRKSKITKIKHPKRYEKVGGIKFYRWSNYLDLIFLYKILIKKEKIDLINIFSKGLKPLSYIKFLKNFIKKPIIFSLIGSPENTIYDEKLFIKTINNVDIIIFTSKFVFDELKEIKRENCLYVPYGIDLNKFKAKKRKKKQTKNIICLRPPSKNLLIAFKKINDEIENIYLTLNKSMIEEDGLIKNFIRRNKIKNIKIIPVLKDISTLFNYSELIVDLHSPKKYLECASPPLLILEAMACEAKILSTNLPEIREIIEDNKNGFLIGKDSSSEQIYYGIKKALKSKEGIGSNARKTISRKYDIKKIVLKYEKIYKTIINS